MPITDRDTYKVLANCLQTSFGKNAQRKINAHYLTMAQHSDEQVQIRFAMQVIVSDVGQAFTVKDKAREEATKCINEVIKEVEEEYKKQVKFLKDTNKDFDGKKTIKLRLQEETIADELEYIHISPYNPIKKAFYKLQAAVEIK